jgi:hypothetical protein
VLGLKGKVSEFELTTLRAQLYEATVAKARRGELPLVHHIRLGIGRSTFALAPHGNGNRPRGVGSTSVAPTGPCVNSSATESR